MDNLHTEVGQCGTEEYRREFALIYQFLIGGLQLLAIGVIGEYIGKIYLETKARPRYIIEKVLN